MTITWQSHDQCFSADTRETDDDAGTSEEGTSRGHLAAKVGERGGSFISMETKLW